MKELKEYKERKKLTWPEIAEMLNYSLSYIANVMNESRKNPSDRFIKAVNDLIKKENK